MSPIKVIICDAKGRVGRTLVGCAQSDPELQLVGEIDQGDDLAKVIARTDVIVDFSVREATATVAKLAADHKRRWSSVPPATAKAKGKRSVG